MKLSEFSWFSNSILAGLFCDFCEKTRGIKHCRRVSDITGFLLGKAVHSVFAPLKPGRHLAPIIIYIIYSTLNLE